MNRHIRFVILMVGFTLLPLFAVAANNMADSTTPVQAYQSAAKPPLATKKITAHKVQKKSTAQPLAQPAQPKSSYLDRQRAQILQAELTQLNQNNLAFQQQIDERLIELSNKHQLLEQQLRRLTQALTLLNQEVAHLKKNDMPPKQVSLPQPMPSTVASTVTRWIQIVNKHLGPLGFKMAVGGVIVLIILLAWAVWPRNKKKKIRRVSRDPNVGDVLDDDTQAEYDYMGSAEGIPAKLDLARTYIAMEDYEAAQKVLAEVNKHGNDAHKQQAQVMLNEIPAES